ncbi:MAG: homocysteine S-methyltransferase family protein [Oscillospiraceae bacterium]|nr:homocysteine S-methyltransferase family protein [Oscillospiraceae bacterium]
MTRQEFHDLAARGAVILDGATGSNLRAAGMPVGVSPELWVLEHPEALLNLQRAYVDARTMILCAPTFSANRLSLQNFGLEERVGELNARLAALSREAAGGRALVAGDRSTLGRPLEPVGDMPYSTAYDIYREQMEALAEAGVDLLAMETLMGADEAVAALDAAADLDLPVWCSFSAEADGSLMFGGNVWETAAMLQELGAAAVGVNCSVGPNQLESVIRSIREAVDIPVVAKPNAGLPVMDGRGQAHYSMGPQEFARHMRVLAEAGAGVLGGCCGTTPDYIRHLAAALA